MVIIPDRAEAGSPIYDDPEVEVTLDRDSFTSKDMGGRIGPMVTITGTIVCRIPEETPPKIEVRITLLAYGDDDSYLGEYDVDFRKTDVETASFSISWFISREILEGSRSQGRLTGNWNYRTVDSDPEEIEEIPFTIVAGQHGDLELKNIDDLDTQDFPVGEWYQFQIHVISYCNCYILCDLEVLDGPDNIIVEFPDSPLEIDPFGSKLVEIEIMQAEGYPIMDRIRIRGTSNIGGHTRADILTVMITTYDPESKSEVSLGIYYWIMGGGFLLIFIIVMVIFVLRLAAISRNKESFVEYQEDHQEYPYDEYGSN